MMLALLTIVAAGVTFALARAHYFGRGYRAALRHALEESKQMHGAEAAVVLAIRIRDRIRSEVSE